MHARQHLHLNWRMPRGSVRRVQSCANAHFCVHTRNNFQALEKSDKDPETLINMNACAFFLGKTPEVSCFGP